MRYFPNYDSALHTFSSMKNDTKIKFTMKKKSKLASSTNK